MVNVVGRLFLPSKDGLCSILLFVMKIVRQVLQEYFGKVDQLREALSCTLYLRIDFKCALSIS